MFLLQAQIQTTKKFTLTLDLFFSACGGGKLLSGFVSRPEKEPTSDGEVFSRLDP